MLWLTELKQNGDDVTIEGRSTTLIALSDFVGNLGTRRAAAEADRDRQQPGRDARRRAEPGRPPSKLIRFTVKAQLAPPAATAAARGRGAGAARRRADSRRCAGRDGDQPQSQQAAVVRPARRVRRAVAGRRRRLLELLRAAGAGEHRRSAAAQLGDAARGHRPRPGDGAQPAGVPPRGRRRSKRSSSACAPCCRRSRTSPTCCAASRRWRRSRT